MKYHPFSLLKLFNILHWLCCLNPQETFKPTIIENYQLSERKKRINQPIDKDLQGIVVNPAWNASNECSLESVYNLFNSTSVSVEVNISIYCLA